MIIEKHENFQKQSYRNRCYIYGGNGRQVLVVPVIKRHGEKSRVSTVEIDNRGPWQRIHIKSIHSAYQNSPFYEFYADDFNDLYAETPVLLFEWNLRMLEYILKQLNIQCDIQQTPSFEKTPAGLIDYRQTIHPKIRWNKYDKHFLPVHYQQVFEERYGFIPNLSIIDLLFNEGPNARQILLMSRK